MKIPRCNTNGVVEYEVTVTSDTHKQREQRNRKEKRNLHPSEAQTKTEHKMMVLRHGGAPLVAESGVGRLPECTG